LVDPTASLDAVEKRKSVTPTGNWIPAIKHVTRCYTNWAASYDTTVLLFSNIWKDNSVLYFITLQRISLQQTQSYPDTIGPSEIQLRVCAQMWQSWSVHNYSKDFKHSSKRPFRYTNTIWNCSGFHFLTVAWLRSCFAISNILLLRTKFTCIH
jgi:hypothetical protein